MNELVCANDSAPQIGRPVLADGDLTSRQRLLDVGVENLSDKELLAILLGHGRGVDVELLSATMLDHFQGLRGMSKASKEAWYEIKGVGPARYAAVRAALELGRRCLKQSIQMDGPLESPKAAESYVHAMLADRPREVFACLFLDTRHRVICFEELFLGTIDGAVVHPREVVRQALLENAAAVIAVHNHPSGVAEPSQADVALTHRLRDALALVDVRLLDHLVVGQTETVSMSARGMM